MTADTWASRLYEQVRNFLPSPHFYRCTPALRHKPMATNDELDFDSDIRYLQDLQYAIIDDCRLAQQDIGADLYADFFARPLLVASQVPVESQRFWETWDWPVDHAAHLITMWKFDNEMAAWMAGECAA